MEIPKQYLLDQASLSSLFGALIQRGDRIVAPVEEKGRVVYRQTDRMEEVAQGFVQTTLSAKEVVFPAIETLYTYKKTKQAVDIRNVEPEKMPHVVLWGVKPCDAAGFGALGAIFNWDYIDEIYNARRDRVTIIGFSCNQADESCFCTSVGGGPGSTVGSDLLITPLVQGQYLAEAVTPKGQDLVAGHAGLFREASPTDKEPYLAKVEARFDREEIRTRLYAFFKSELWDEQSRRCLGCGACAYVCPTCACFDIQDEKRGKRGTHFRCWDSCGFSLFTLHTSGHNPREEQNQRWRQRLLHKFSYMPDRLTVVGCTGCGRCSRACPVDMNILEHLTSISEMSHESK